MADSLQITVDVIVHATEDISKFFNAFYDILELEERELSTQHTTGHYGNPITLLGAKLQKRQAEVTLKVLLGKMTTSQKHAMTSEMTERTVGSKFHIRLSKQEFLAGNIRFAEKDAIRFIIQIPIYNKKDASNTFKKIFQ